MGLSQALFSAISGLSSHQRSMDNIGNNLGNVNTVAFKKGVYQFSTLLDQNIQGGTAADPERGRGVVNPIAIGLGTQTGSINRDYRQGSFETTGNARDMAIEGNGYFVLRNQNSNVFTRDGTFYLGTDGTLLGGNGLAVQGVSADEDGKIAEAGEVGDISIPIGRTGAARETTEISLTGNLNSDVEIARPHTVTTNDLPPSNVAATNTSSWVTGTAGQSLNFGHVETSAALYDSEVNGGGVAGAADGTTLLSDMQYLRGTALVTPFSGISQGEEINLSFTKGGRKMEATFTYGAYPNGDGTTVQDMMNFLTGGYNDDATGAAAQRLTGGAMGTVHVRPRSTAVDGYNAVEEHGGSYFRSFVTTDAQAVDYDNDGTNDVTNRLSICSNLGEENAIEDIQFSYNNINFTDIFSSDVDYGTVEGGSTTTNMVVYDSLGNPKTVTMQMTLVDRDTNFSTWRWIADSADDTDATWNFDSFNDTTSTSTSINVGTGLIRFDSEGRYVRGSELSETSGIEISLNNQGVNDPMTIGITEGLSSDQDQKLDFGVLTQVASASDFNLREQDGSAPGTLDTFAVTLDGVVQGVFSNGQVETIGRMSIALVPNEAGMMSLGNNVFATTPSSGEAQIDFAGVGGRGSVRAGALETSNVELSEEFTRLITVERGFQANARVISTSDEMLVELVNLKR